jgi:hypothetical protein
MASRAGAVALNQPRHTSVVHPTTSTSHGSVSKAVNGANLDHPVVKRRRTA